MTPTSIKQVEVQIMSQNYTLACPPEGEPALREAVNKVDGAMCRIRDAGKVKARDRIAVLAALNIAFELSQKDSAAPPFRNSSFGGQHEPGEQADTLPAASGVDPVPQKLQALLQRLDRALAQPLGGTA